MISFKNERSTYTLPGIVDTCPICHHGIVPIFVTHVSMPSPPGIPGRFEVILRCPRHSCFHVYIARCKVSGSSASEVNLSVDRILPKELVKPAIAPEVEKVSQSFVSIYQQAKAAESYGLKEVTGIALRKALEFLVKDFCAYLDPSRSDEIKGANLMYCIKTFIKDTNINACAERAAWLGNDETHYIRRWEDKDITDLNTLVDLTAGWIRHVVLTKKYLDEMPEGKKP
ncbi:MAG: DUF4145 domain-containing protein [Dokdonella sp.]|nr:DUF4145 domain-containing protein [Dokdonella sp.]